MKVKDGEKKTHILLQCSTPDSYNGCNKALGVHTDIGDSTDGDTKQHEDDTQLGTT
jgi:hypothetical protein